MPALLWLFPMLVLFFSLPARAGYVEEISQRFADSEIVFPRANTLVPFLPLASLGASVYNDTEVELDDGRKLEYDLQSVTQHAVLPMLVSPRDALFVGEYLGYSDFDMIDPVLDDFEVTTVGLPVGWLRQVSDDWQLAAFAMPLAHRSTLEGSGWNMQYVGGMFGRYQQTDGLWWLFGVYADVAPEEDSLIPYVGASWNINEHWTLSAIMPWPAVTYSPDGNWLFRLGASPSGASWVVATGDGDVGINYDAWDLDFGVEGRVRGNFWLRLRAGVGGLRGLRFSDGSYDAPDIDVGASGFFALELNFRPSVNP